MAACGSGGDEPTPPPKTDHKATYTIGTLPEGVSLSGTTLTVPPNFTKAAIKNIFESGKVTDPDGKAGITSVTINENKITVTYYGTDGRDTTKTVSSTLVYTLVISELTATFPKTIGDNNTVEAGNADFFSQLFALEIPLNDGTTATPTEILINNKKVANTHIINVPETYTLQIVIKKEKSTLQQEYTLVVTALEIKTNKVEEYKNPESIIFDKGDLDQKRLSNKMGIPNVQ